MSGGERSGERSGLARVLRRPLTSYHLVLGSATLLLVLGVVMVFSASSVMSQQVHGSPYYIVLRQLMWIAIGVPLTWAISRMKVTTIRRLALFGLLASVFLLVLTFVPGLGVAVGGNQNWVSFGGPIRLQPSEFAKLALVLWAAHVFALKGRLLGQWRHLLVPVVPVSIGVIALVIGQRDLGTAAVIMGIVLALLWIVGVPSWLFGLGMTSVAVVGAYFVATAGHRMERLRSVADPLADITGSTAQAAHSIFAFANGGLLGTGLGGSVQKWGGLPEAHTDFIFAIIGEELGLPGSLVVLLLFLALGYGGVRIAMRTKDTFIRVAAGGIVAWILLQTLINMGSVVALLPVIGIPLPLVSYGGSALLPTLLAVGVLLAFAREEPGARDALAARKRSRRERRAARRALRDDQEATV